MATATKAAPEGRYVEANGLRIYYEEYGSGEPLLLLHPGTFTSSSRRAHAPAFAAHFHVIAPDSRGHGHTASPSGEMSYRTMADDMAALIDVMGLEKVLVCGYSDGEQIALELGMRCPELCRALLAGAVWCTFTKQYLHAIKAFGVEGSGSVDFARLESDNAGLVEWWRGEHAPLGESDGWKAMLGQISRLWWTPLDYTSDDLARITVPTLILQGDRDGLIPIEQGVGLFGRLPNAELAVLPGRNHLSALAVASGEERSTGYEPFVPVVLDFLMRNGGRRVPGTVAQGVDRT